MFSTHHSSLLRDRDRSEVSCSNLELATVTALQQQAKTFLRLYIFSVSASWLFTISNGIHAIYNLIQHTMLHKPKQSGLFFIF